MRKLVRHYTETEAEVVPKKGKNPVVKAEALPEAGAEKIQDQEMEEEDDDDLPEGRREPIKVDELMDETGAASNSNVSFNQKALVDFEVDNYAGGLWDKCAHLTFVEAHPWAVERVPRPEAVLIDSIRDIAMYFPVMKPHELAKMRYGDEFRNFWTLDALTAEQ